MWPVDCTYSLASGHLSTYRASTSVGGYSSIIQKLFHFTHFNQKYTHISGCKVVHNYTNATVTVHICTVIVACVFTILIISSLSYVWLSFQLSLSHFIIALSFSHLNSTKLISFSFFFKILGFKDEGNDSSAEISRATDWVRSASELGTPIGLFDPTIRLETETVTENWSDMEGEACYYLDSSCASSGAMEFLCGAEVSNSSAVEDRDDESRWWWGLGVLIFCGVWIYYLDFLWGLEFLFGFSVGFGISVWIFCEVMVGGWVGGWVDGCGWFWVCVGSVRGFQRGGEGRK